MPINSMPLCDKKLFPVDSTADSSMHKIVAPDVVTLLQPDTGPFLHQSGIPIRAQSKSSN